MDLNKHKLLMLRILNDIFTDKELAASLAFKGGTALMFFYQLPRFSVDLDFNLLCLEKSDTVYEKLRLILLKYGKIHDQAKKFYGLLLVLDYGVGERKLKLEVSNRQYGDHYELKNLLGIPVRVMQLPDMFAHKLCALLDRGEVAGRDVFDCWFFLNQRTPINHRIVEERMGGSLQEHIENCIALLEQIPNKVVMNGLGEVTDGKMKSFARNELRLETLSMLRFFHQFPILVQ